MGERWGIVTIVGGVDLLKPDQLFVGRYRIERALARGGMGAVYVAEQLATELSVAIKVLYPHVLSSTDAVEKFQLEAKVAARVNSDHIVKVIDAGYDRDSGMPFLAMELLDGQELHSLVEAHGPLSHAAAAEVVRQVAEGLDRAHGYTNREGVPEPIVHRDLKPENLFVARRSSGDPIVKILDFGIAKVLSDTAAVSQEIKGTPLFMAYEQVAGGPLGAHTDVWALGLIAFFLLTGRTYWKSGSSPAGGVNAVFAEILNLPIEPPSDRAVHFGLRPTWPPAFDGWFLRCLDRDPAGRHESAGEASRSLRRALGEPVRVSLAGVLDAAASSGPGGNDPTQVSAGLLSERAVGVVTPTSRRRTGRTIRVRLAVAATIAVGVILGIVAGQLLLASGTNADRTRPPARASAIGSHRQAQPHPVGPELVTPAVSPTTSLSGELLQPPSPSARTSRPRPIATSLHRPAPAPAPVSPGPQPPVDPYGER